MAKPVEIDLKVNTQLDSAAKRAQEYYNTVSKQGGFKDNPKNDNAARASLQIIDSLVQKSSLTKNELNAIGKEFNKLYDILIKASKGIQPISEEFAKIQRALVKKSNVKREKIDEKNAILEKGRANKDRNQLTSLSTFPAEIANANIYKLNQNGQKSKQQIKSFEALEKNYKSGDLDEEGKSLYVKLKGELDDYNSQLKSLTSTIEKLTVQTEDLKNKMQQAKPGSIKSGDQVDLLSGLTEEKIGIQDIVSQEKTNQSIEEGKKATEEADAAFAKMSDTVNKQSSTFGKVVKNFTIYRIALGLVKKAIHESVKTVTELDKSLTEQAMVTGKTRQQTYALLKQYQTMAIQLGATSKEVAEVTTQFMRQGKTVQDSLTLTSAAISAAKVAGISAVDSVNYLTTALNGFQLSANEAMKVSDRFAAIAANSATSYEEIAIALSKVASQANLAGMSIDYTTALLAKGLETTREAPETIGTALKTVIARMREMADYGETLAGDTDINNVETQLAYVGIALKNNNGELRSTEDVLDELGRKWDTLDANQQAAVAKALAGTRQQSRLIAMMTDYERVIELQEISLRSAGATSAQASVYLEGMEAALNRISVAWERIVSAVTDSDVVINLVELVANGLDVVGGMLENSVALVTITTTLAALSVSMLGNKIRELSYQKQLKQYNAEIAIEENKIAIEKRKSEIKTEQAKKVEIAQNKVTIAQAKLEAAIKSNDVAAQEAARAEIATAEGELNKELKIQDEIETSTLFTEDAQLKLLTKQGEILESNTGFTKNLYSGFTAWLIPIQATIGLVKTLSAVAHKANKQEEKDIEAKTAKERKLGITRIASNVAAYIPIVGAIAAAAILGVTLVVSAVNKFNQNNDASNQINILSDKIYTLQKTITALDTGLNTFDKLDNQLIKTKQTAEDMANALDTAADKLSNEQQEVYNGLTTNAQKAEYLRDVYKELEKEIDNARQEQLRLIKDNPLLLTDTTSDARKVQSAVYSQANVKLYEAIDKAFSGKTTEEAQKVEKFTQSILENMTALDALDYATNSTKMAKLVSTVRDLDIASIMTSDDASLEEKLAAYNKGLETLKGTARESFKSLYEDIGFFNELTVNATSFIDSTSLTVDNLNDIYRSFEKVSSSTEEARQSFKNLFTYLGEGQDIQTALDNFGLAVDDYNTLLNSLGSAFGVSMLDMGQNMDKLINKVQNIYETASKWNSMSNTEKTQFLSENQNIIDTDKLLTAFETGDYNVIQEMLLNDETLQNAIDKQLKDIEIAIQIERAKGEKANTAYIKTLEQDYKKMLSDRESFLQASLETRLEQENKQLEHYKQYLKDEQDALVESLNKRKDAYTEYFDAVNQEADDLDYEKKSEELMTNIAKIGATADSSSQKQQADLVNELERLEEERIKTLRERAQEAVVNNIESQVEKINENFEKLLDSNRELLNALTNALSTDPAGLMAQMYLSRLNSGATDLEAESELNNLKTIYGSSVSGINFDNIKNTSVNNLNLDINGQTVNLSPEKQQDLYEIIRNALMSMGEGVN